MGTVELTIPVAEERQDPLLAGLEAFGFEGFLCEEEQLKAYLPGDCWDARKRAEVEAWLQAQGISAPLEERVLEDENWNSAWEQKARPVAVGPFLITPTWMEPPAEHAEKILIEIDPKMSFGTGHHASTRLALRLLSDLAPDGARVLDAGTGTGILAIAAAKLGATEVLAFDTDAWAQKNAAENIKQNNVEARIELRMGSIEAVPETGFDLILANITRDVLIELLPALAEKLRRPNGCLVLSGLLRAARPAILDAATQQQLFSLKEAGEEEWWAVALMREPREGQ